MFIMYFYYRYTYDKIPIDEMSICSLTRQLTSEIDQEEETYGNDNDTEDSCCTCWT